MHMKRIVVGVSVAAVAAVAAVACSSSSSPATTGGPDWRDPETPRRRSRMRGPPGRTLALPLRTRVEEWLAPAAPPSMHASVGTTAFAKALDAIVANELMDLPDIASYFFNQVANPIPAGHPNADQITECFTILLADRGRSVHVPAGWRR